MRRYIVTVLLFGVMSFAFIAMYRMEMKPVESLMRPPVYENAQNGIGKILKDILGENVTYKTVSYNNKKTSIIYEDINGDGTKEALVVAQNSENDLADLYLFEKKDDGWIYFGKTDISFYDADKLELSDMDSDGVCEIILGCYSSTDFVGKQLRIYSLDPKKQAVISLYQSDYTVYGCVDINLDGKRNVFLIAPDSSDSGISFEAGFLVYDKQIVKKGVYDITPTITSVLAVNYDNAGNSFRIFVDGVSPDGNLVTEALAWNVQSRQFYCETADGINICQISKRDANILATDVNDDGFLEIPVEHKAVEKGESYIEWIFVLDDSEKSVGYMIDNHKVGYYFLLSEDLKNNLAFVRMNNGELLKFYVCDSNGSINYNRPVFEIKAISNASRNTVTKAYKPLCKNSDYAYYYKLYDDAKIFAVSENTLQKLITFGLKGCIK